MNDREGVAKQVTLRPEQLKALARYELTFDKIGIGEDVQILCSEDYAYTLEDLKQAVIHLQQVDPEVEVFCERWFSPLEAQEEHFGILTLLYPEADEDDTPEYLKEYAEGLPVSDSAQFRDVWWRLDHAVEACGTHGKLSQVIPLDEIIKQLDRYQENKGKPIEKWQFTTVEKENYIALFDSADYVKNASENQLSLCRQYIDELCETGSYHALHTKGYACYGGNRLYPCDWNIARDYISHLFEKKDEPQYANTLGYIYYYGRCNGGVPEYDKAFYYFGIAAANGIYEGMYKLGDMFWNGYGCKKSPRTAGSLYRMVYGGSFRNFQKGGGAKFADAALRMGYVYAQGIGVKQNPIQAYFYYLQAEYAARLRGENSDFFGDKTVAANIQKAIAEIKTRLPKDYFSDHVDYEYPLPFEQLAEDGNRCELKRAETPDGSVVLTASRKKARGQDETDCVLITAPKIGYCQRRKDFSLSLVGLSELWFQSDALCVPYDYCELSWRSGRYEFYHDDELVAYVKCQQYRLLAADVG
jgi:TPR repeat protein